MLLLFLVLLESVWWKLSMNISLAPRLHKFDFSSRSINCNFKFTRKFLNLLNFAHINRWFVQRHFISTKLNFSIFVRKLLHTISHNIIFFLNKLFWNFRIKRRDYSIFNLKYLENRIKKSIATFVKCIPIKFIEILEPSHWFIKN